jgi:two-component system sensor histidine kinase AlgZ
MQAGRGAVLMSDRHMPSRRGTTAIVFAALIRASAMTRRTVWWTMIVSVAMIALQVWDVSWRWGPAAIAELLSVCAAVAGVVLLGLVSAIGAGSGSFSAAEDDELRPVLVALPSVAFVAGMLISAAIAFMIARGLFGIHHLRVIGVSALLVLALVLAWVTVRDTTRLLFDRAERRGALAAKARAELADARMSALQARMQPHFLFNALNTIAALVKTDPDAAEATVEDLSAILRASLKQGDATTRPLREELALVRAFVGVEQRRLGTRLKVTWNVAPGALDAPVPVLSLQPLVENAIKHGIASRIAGGAVTVHVEQAGDSLTLTVTDDGEGFARGWAEGTGLGNVRQRLHSLYGGRASLAINPGPGASVTMTIPRAPG